ncbi:unnamed protein product [Effrenium voratum]|uniref:Uncharacterized protein n=1 Tax=Effrenium voratum TaxID=2562239 RepID=A0AA36ITP5_9DINO|nr:unnamed protein product [Effrenium voratum]CAJ1460255.1 unnamed protein product [Effrenium voratum]
MNSVAAMVAALLCIAHGSVETCMAPKRARHVLAGTGAEGDFELVLKEETVATGRWSGNKLWPGALALLGRLSELAPRAPRARVLELGCGLPLLAAALAQLGAEVCATDHPSVMDQVRAAVKEELIEGLSSSAIQRLRFEPLQWGEPLNLTPCGFQAVDLIVGADLVYDGFPVDALYQSLKELMGMYSGTVMLALQPRRFPMTAALREPRLVASFLKRFAQDGFQVSVEATTSEDLGLAQQPRRENQSASEGLVIATITTSDSAPLRRNAGSRLVYRREELST